MAFRFLVLLLFIATTALVSSSSTSTSLSTTNTTAAGDNNNNAAITFSFSTFHADARATNLTVVGDANINGGALQITPDSLNDASHFLTNKSGRVLFSTPFKLWHRHANANSTAVASFTTVFTVNVFRPNGTSPGEGFAFLIAPTADAPPAGSTGGYLGLTNAATDGNAANKIVAVELDTERQPYDPDDNHVGLDVNGVVSVATAPLRPRGIEISPAGKAVKYDVWVDYDGVERRVAAYMAVAGNAKPAAPVLAAPLDLAAVVAEWSYFGFSASTGFRYQLNCVLAWNMTVEKLTGDDDDDGDRRKILILALAIGVPVAAVALAAALGFIYVVKRRKVNGGGGDDGSAITGTLIRSMAGGPREFDYRELRKATNNFDERMKLGQGGYGVVYRGVVAAGDSGGGRTVEVAVKKFSRESTQGQNDFLAELSIINRLRHKHLVRLVGWSHNNGELLLVYEYMPNGSLDQHLFSSPPAPPPPSLGWDLRYSILSGVASALHYLHDEYDQKVIHRDLKASNIMLDAAFSARLGDFGLARAIDTDKTSYMENSSVAGGVHGTVGYIAPECFHTEKATRESDVYAFGAVVLEVVCGRRPRCGGDGDGEVNGFGFLVDWVWRLHRDGRVVDAVDQRLGGEFDAGDAERLLLLGLACSHPTPAERPRTMEITQILLRSAPPPVVPPFKPSFVWPAVVDGDTMTSSSHVSTEVVSSTSTWSGNFVRGADRSRAPLPEQDASGFTV